MRTISAGLLLMSSFSCGQDTQTEGGFDDPVQPRANKESPPQQQKTEPPADVPSDSGIIAVPPKTGPAVIKTPPENLDPALDDATRDIDKQNREKARQQQEINP